MMPARSTPNLQDYNTSGKSNRPIHPPYHQQPSYPSSPTKVAPTSRDESPPPAPPVRDSSTLKSIKYGPGHEKFPSWPVPAVADTPHALRSQTASGGSHRSKSWTDHTNYPKEKVVTYTRPYMKKQHSSYTQQKLKTVMEKCEKIPPQTFESPRQEKVSERVYIPQVDHDGKYYGDKNYAVPSPPERDIAMKPHLTQADLESYVRSFSDPSQMHYEEKMKNKQYPSDSNLDDYSDYSKNYEDSLFSSMGSKSDDSLVTHLHQKQLSYAQSEGYHSYVSSTDSTSTPFLDRLRRDSDAVVRSASATTWDSDQNDQGSRREGRDSVVTTSSGSASSSETLKWLGSISDVSVASSSCTHLANSSNSRQLIAHSARVQTPQRHHSESVLFMSPERQQEVWKDKECRNNNANKLKLFPLNTYTVQEMEQNSNHRSPTTSLSVADRINELEKQQKYSYLYPDKKHKIPDPTLKAIQKKALLSFYERHHSKDSKNASWRSEPQLAQAQVRSFSIPQPPMKINLPSRRASSASDYATEANLKRSSLVSRESKTTDTISKGAVRHQHSNSCGSLSTDLLGPVIVGPSISLDDWIPDRPPKRPPKNPNLKAAFPDLFQDSRLPSPDLPPPSPPTVLEDEVFNCDDPLPPPPPECDSKWSGNDKNETLKLHACKTDELKQTVGVPSSLSFSSVRCCSVKTRQTDQIFQVASKPYNAFDKIKTENNDQVIGFPRNYAERSSTRYPTPQKLALNGNVVVSHQIQNMSGQFWSEPLRPQHNDDLGKLHSNKDGKRSSLVETRDNPPPLHPRQMRVNQSMRLSSQDRKQMIRSSPPRDIRDPKLETRSQSKASYLASKRDRDRIVPDSDTGSYKRTMSPNGHALTSEVISNESPKINSRETMWPINKNKEIITTNTTIIRRSSINGKQVRNEKCHEESRRSSDIVLPDVLPMNAKLLNNRSHFNKPPRLNFSSLDNCNDNSKNTSPKFSSLDDNDTRTSSLKTPSPPLNGTAKEPSFTTLRSMSTTSLINSSTVVTSPSRDKMSPIINGTPLSLKSSIKSATLPLKSPPSPIKLGKGSPTILKKVINSSTSTSPPSPKRTSPPIKQQLSPSSSMKISPLRISPASSSVNSSPLQISPLTTPSSSPKAISMEAIPQVSPTKLENNTPIVDTSIKSSKPEFVLRVNPPMSDASSQTEKEELPPTPLPSRKKLQEEIECEKLSLDFITHLPTSGRLKDLLGPSYKKSTDYVHGLFKVDIALKPRPPNSPFRSTCSTPSKSPPPTTLSSEPSSLPIINGSSTTSLSSSSPPITETNKNSLSGTLTYLTISEPKAKMLTRFSQDLSKGSTLKDTKDLHQKKEELVNRLGKKLEVLRNEQLVVSEESKLNEELGENVESHINKLARPQEAAKFRLHVEEIGKITSLLLGLSGRLARAENALLGMTEDHPEKKVLEDKRDKLAAQLEEAKSLKENIDRRSISVSNILSKYLDSEEFADYDHFINMKAKLIMDSKEIADKIKLGEEQLLALKETPISVD